MKFIFSIVGLGLAWSVYKYAPTAFPTIVGGSGFSGLVTLLAAGLTSVWAGDLTRLSVFEKLDDLTGEQKAVAVKRSKLFRRRITNAMIANAFVWLVISLAVYLSSLPNLKDTLAPIIGYLLCASVFFWVGGFIESWVCWFAIDNSRLSLAEAQSANKQRQKYLDKMRDDEAKAPVNRTDEHLKGYTQDYKPC